MRSLRLLSLAFRTLLAHKIRTLLSVFCIATGVLSLVLIAGFRKGASEGERQAFERLEGGVLRILMTQERVNPRGGARPGEFKPRPLEWSRLEPTFREAMPFLREFSIYRCDDWDLSRDKRLASANGVSNIFGVTPAFMTVRNLSVIEGRALTDADLQNSSRVIVLGSAARDALFGSAESPLWQNVQFFGQTFTVIGVLDRTDITRSASASERARKQNSATNSICLVPITAFNSVFGPVNPSQSSANRVRAEALLASSADFDRLQFQWPNLVRRLTGAEGGYKYDFESKARRIEALDRVATNNLAISMALGGITLLVGALSIMNLMLASVRERLREIGLLQSIGARASDIFLQFLAESVLVSVLGAATGAILGAALIHYAPAFLPDRMAPPLLSAPAFLTGICGSLLAGLLAGLHPALSAASLDPIEAMRQD